MVKRPRRPREIKRSTEARDATVASRPVIRPRDPRQAELFRTDFIPPCKPTLVAEPPEGARWRFEIKHDGYRAQCHVNAGVARIYTKSGYDWAARMPGIIAALERLPVDSAVIDGEAVVGEDGISDFFALHSALAKKGAPQAFLYAFDLLHLDGQDLREQPLDERRLLLEDLLVREGEPQALRFSEAVDGGPADIVAAACRMGLEGVVAKRQDAPYRSGPSKTWLKVKCTEVGTFGVIGFQPGLLSLDLAELKDGELVSVGSVGAGLSERAVAAIKARMGLPWSRSSTVVARRPGISALGAEGRRVGMRRALDSLRASQAAGSRALSKQDRKAVDQVETKSPASAGPGGAYSGR